MVSILKKLFGGGEAPDFMALQQQGAQIVDVRSVGEYRMGHIKGSMNIPLDSLRGNLSKLKKDKPVITCCASGMRSATAKSILKSNGFTEVYNGGGWSGLQYKLK